MKKNNKGFSLVELIVVIAVMAVLVVVLAPAYLRYVDKTRLQKDISAISEVVSAVKTSAVEEEIEDEIVNPTNSNAYETIVEIDENTGEVIADLVEKSGTDNKDANDLLTAIQEIVGKNVEFSHPTIKEKGIELKVEKDADYIVRVSVETYEYDNDKDREIYLALRAAFPSYKSGDKVTEAMAEAFREAFAPIWEKHKNTWFIPFLGTGGQFVRETFSAAGNVYNEYKDDLSDSDYTTTDLVIDIASEMGIPKGLLELLLGY